MDPPAACSQDLDKPGSAWDFALLAAAIVASLPFIAANIVVLLHRKRRYFGVQGGALLILTSSIAGLIWITATFVTNMHFPRNHPVLLICPLWSFWLRLTFGFWLWLACHALRLLHLHHLCQNALSFSASAYSSRCRMLFWAVLLWTPGLAFTIVATAVGASVPKQDEEVCANCELQGPWKLCTYIILPSIYFAILVILLIYAKSNNDYMMAVEYSHTSEYSFMMAFVIYLVYGAAILAESQIKIPGRCFLTFCVCCLIFINFWVRFGRPVYLCLCKSKSDMDSFEEELRMCGAECLDQLSSATIGTSQTGRRSSSARQFGDWILRAIDAAMNEVSECKERINQLEQRKAMLSAKIKQLEVPASPQFMFSSGSIKGL